MAVYNPLHYYRNYVPHFALVIVQDTVAANQFYEPAANTKAGMNLYSHPPGGLAAKYEPQGANKDYVVLFNSTTDAEFYIDRLELNSLLQMQGQHVADGYDIHAVGLTMSMKIIEPYTVDFLTTVHAANVSVHGTNLLNAQFLLKIFFVGYTDGPDGEDIVDIIPFVEPIVFTMAQIDMALTHAGTEYVITCITDSNAGNNIKTNDIGGITLLASKTVSSMIDDLNDKLAARADVASLNIKLTNPSIKYKVILDPAYRDPKYAITNITPAQQNNYPGTGDPKNVQLVTGRGDTLPATITNIMLLSDAVVAESRLDKPPAPGAVDKTYVHKIHTRSTQVGNETTYYFYVLRHAIIVSGDQAVQADESGTEDLISAAVNSITKILTKPDTAPLPLIDESKGSAAYLEYDYLYTGKNVDITQYTMSIPIVGDGTPFVLYQPQNQVTSIEQVKTAENQQDPKHANPVPKTNVNDTATVSAYNTTPTAGKVASTSSTPLPVMDNSGAGKGAANAATFYQGRQILTRYISNTTISAAMEIYGNPILLQTIMQPLNALIDPQGQPLPPEEIKKQLELRQELGGLGGGALTMNLVKINVRVPKPAHLQGGTFDESSDVDYENKFSTKFWNNGMFTIMTIDHIFETNKFVQRMKLVLNPTPNSGGANISDASTSQSTTPGGNNNFNMPKVKLNTIPKNRFGASAEARKIIESACESFCMDPNLIYAIMGQESGGNAGAVSYKGARGLMQLMPKTAQGLGVSIGDPTENLVGGIGYVAGYLNQFNGNLNAALSCYNGGIKNYQDSKARHNGGSDFVTQIPETIEYVARITRAYGSTHTNVPCTSSNEARLRQDIRRAINKITGGA